MSCISCCELVVILHLGEVHPLYGVDIDPSLSTKPRKKCHNNGGSISGKDNECDFLPGDILRCLQTSLTILVELILTHIQFSSVNSVIVGATAFFRSIRLSESVLLAYKISLLPVFSKLPSPAIKPNKYDLSSVSMFSKNVSFLSCKDAPFILPTAIDLL